MAAVEYTRILDDASRLNSREQVRLVRDLVVRISKRRRRADLSRMENAVAYVRGLRIAESRDAGGRLKNPRQFLADLQSWED